LTEYDRFWQSYKGRIDKTMTVNFVNLLPKFSSEDTLYFICGPQGMMDAVKEGLSMLKVPQNKIFTESFYAAPATVASSLEEGAHQVIIRLNGQTHRIAVPAKKTILETALDNGIDMPYSCQNGLCTACRCKCLSGSVKMLRGDGLTDEEIAQGYVLTCVGVPTTPTVELEVG
ncbi:MAG: 2Fe-2S iron-sulfur cluster-binding protein, partial [Flammeovirgaceae bacterium]|nr:2Fe-2S iron-sulfur cluster-binding protein [Flammeovirgaceae bacterium]MDW8286450.1 2Fe-2S iron-sulfur cluster-binding protein [Flammeovirgaceae bacterium]